MNVNDMAGALATLAVTLTLPSCARQPPRSIGCTRHDAPKTICGGVDRLDDRSNGAIQLGWTMVSPTCRR
jgi:hypothetical protein